MRKVLALLAVPAFSIGFCGCSALMGDVRPDLNDQQNTYDSPTVGGRWSERGFLDDGVGHSDRTPASMTDNQNPDWVDQTRDEQNQRDAIRGEGDDGQPSFSNTPNLPPPVRRLYKNGNRATAADFIDESPNEGSLWASDGQTNYYFTKNKIRGVGDIITINIEDDMIRDLGLEVKRTLTDNEKSIEMSLAEDRARARAAGPADGKKSDSVSTSQAAPATSPTGTPSATPDNGAAPTVTPGDIDISKSLQVKSGDTMMAEIIERYPNGNYKIRGTKKILYKNGAPRLVNLVGVVKGSDIGEDDTVPSGKLYEYRLEAIR